VTGFFDRFRHGSSEPADAAEPAEAAPERTVVEIDASSLSRVFAAPMWLRDIGLASWFLVGFGLLLVGIIWLLGLTAAITEPVLVGTILATVAGPLVSKMQRHRVPRAAGAAIVLLGLIAIGILIALLVFGGIVQESSQIKSAASEAVDKIQGWADDAGSGGTSGAADDAQQDAASAGKSLVEGVINGIQGITSLIFFCTFLMFSTFFLLKDGPTIRRFIDRSMGVPPAVATTITSSVIRSLRKYFLGVTIVAAFNAVVVGLGAWALGVPLAGTIAVVTFVTAYIPFIGAFISGALAVILALAGQGTQTAAIMLVIVILANGLLQNIVQPIAFGATLELNPLVVLIVTIGFGAIFGMVGLVLAAPLTSAAVHISRELAAAKAREGAEGPERAPPGEPSPATAL
jgi:putative heme transporter